MKKCVVISMICYAIGIIFAVLQWKISLVFFGLGAVLSFIANLLVSIKGMFEM